MNTLISDQSCLRAIETLLCDVREPCETLILTSAVTATDLAYSVLHSAAARVGEVTVVSHRELGVDPAVDLLDPALHRQSWLECQADTGQRVAFNANIVLIHSDSEVLAAVGSAPLADGRWGSDRDAWTVLRTRCGCAPVALHQLAELLERIAHGGNALPDLDRQFLVDPHTAFALHSMAAEIRSREAIDTEARLLANLDSSIAQQLREHISEPVSDLAVYCPAYHPELHGIDTLINVFRSTGLVAIYTKDQRFDREHLTERARADGTFRPVGIDLRRAHAPGRAPDATVIQWRAQDGQTYALTGLSGICDDTLERTMSADAVALEVATLSQADTQLLPWPKHVAPHPHVRVLALPQRP